MANTQKTYDEEFRKRAVKMLENRTGSKKQIARELGIAAETLRSWEKRYTDNFKPQKEVSEDISKEELLAELKKTQKELAKVTEQREILKKAAAILGN